MTKKLLFCILSIFLSTLPYHSLAKEKNEKKQRTYRLWGHVRDSFTKVGIPDVKITLMRPDSTVIDTVTVGYANNTWNRDSWYYFDRPATPAKYIIKAEHPDYHTCFVDYAVKHVKRNTYFDAPWHFMKRKSRRDSLYAALDEVVVKGSRVKLVHKKDTMIFDAAAFKLPEGSMLDALVKQLPGVELSDDGTITVNGRKVDYLTLNGKDFFKGKNKLMLENLPYYTVKNIKVYDKKTEKSEYVGRNIDKPDYVMDVGLKKEYNKNYIANAEAGGATSERYLARGFGSRITDHSNISAFANFNNANETRKPSGNGDWTPDNAPRGTTTTRSGGLNLTIDDKDSRYKETMDINVSVPTYKNSSSQEVMRIMTGGNTYDINDNSTNNDRHDISFNNYFYLKKPFWLELTTNVSFGGYDQYTRERTANLGSMAELYGEANEILDSIYAQNIPAGLAAQLRNRTMTVTNNKQNKLTLYQKVLINKKLAWGDNIEFEVNGNYEKYDTDYFKDYRLDYYNNSSAADYRNTFENDDQKSYRWEARGEYYLNFLSGWTWRLYSLYNQQRNNKNNDVYRLERLDGWQNGMHHLGEIPADESLLRQAWSEDDSEYDTRITRNSQSGLHFYYNNEGDSTRTWIRFHLPLYVRDEKYHYNRAAVDTCISRNKTFLNGNINMQLQWDGWRKLLSANFWHNTELPDLRNFVDIKDNRNPLYTRLGNPSLKTTNNWGINSHYWFRTKSNRSRYWIGTSYNLWTDPVLTAFSYNKQNGAYTYQPQNGDKTWDYNIYGGTTITLDKKKLWYLDTYVDYTLSGRQVFQLPEGGEQALLFDTKHKKYYGNVSIRYTKDKLNTSLACQMEKKWTSYDAPGIENTRYENIRVSHNLEYTIPVIGLQIASQFGWFYNYSTVEGMPVQNKCIWNMYLSRPILKDKSLLLKLSAYDILNDMSNIYYNANGNYIFSEKQDCLNRYVMLSVAWTFKAKPKK